MGLLNFLSLCNPCRERGERGSFEGKEQGCGFFPPGLPETGMSFSAGRKEEARQDTALGCLGRGGQSWNVCSASGSRLHKRRTRGAQHWMSDLQEGRHWGLQVGLLWLMPAFWLLTSSLTWIPSQTTHPSTQTENPDGHRMDRHTPTPYHNLL